MRNKTTLTLGLSSLAFAAITGSAHAQETSNSTTADALAQEASDSASELPVVIVTAQKREQRLQDVPLAVTALDAKSLDAMGTFSMQDAIQSAPGVTLTRSFTSRNSAVRIRGIGTNSFNDGILPSVATVVDGVVLSRSAQAFTDLIDVERVEVLRGPQGTLFGASATSGVVQIITQAPTQDYSGAMDVTVGDYDNRRVRGTISGPIAGENFLGRLTGFYAESDGYGKDLTSGGPSGEDENYGARLRLLWHATPDFDVSFIADYMNQDSTCCAPTVRSSDLVGSPLFPKASPKNRDTAQSRPMVERNESVSATLQMDYDLGFATLTSISGWRNWQHREALDLDLTPPDLLYGGADAEVDQLSEEIRLASPSGGKLEWMVGYFYQSAENDLNDLFSGGLLGLQPLTPTSARSIDIEQHAVFGQTTWNVTDALKLTGGLRYSGMNMDVNIDRTLSLNPLINGAWAGTVHTLSGDDTDLSGTLSAQYHLSRDTMAYATYSRGYKGIAIDSELTADPAPNGGVLEPETVNSIEVGVKNEFFNRRLQLNLAAFSAKFDDFHASGFNSVTLAKTFYNAGRLDTKGVEFEATLFPTDGLRLFFNGAYLDTAFRDYVVPCPDPFPVTSAPTTYCQLTNSGAPAGPANPYVQDLSGWRLNGAPEWSVDFGGSWNFPLTKGIEGQVAVDAAWTGDYRLTPEVDPFTMQDSYWVGNASFGVSQSEGPIYARVFIRNLTNQTYNYSTTGSPLGLLLYGDTSGYAQTLAPPRTFGVVLGAKF